MTDGEDNPQRCPWHGEVCVCGGALDPSVDPHRGRFAKWQAIDGKAPLHCEAFIPLYMVPAYLRPQTISDELKRRYERWVKDGMHPEAADDNETVYSITDAGLAYVDEA
jgi:hypothetical protein